MGILWFLLGAATGYALNQYRAQVKAWVMDALSRFGSQ
mgnify:FL=1